MVTRQVSAEQRWVTNTPSFIGTLPVLDFPFDRLPELFAPDRTVLRLGAGFRVHCYLWCYLRRKSVHGTTAFDPASLSATRVAELPAALDRLSKWCRHSNARPAHTETHFRRLSLFLAWADAPENEGRYEAVLSDPQAALQALRGYHSLLRSRLQSHQLASATAADRDQRAIACLSVIHNREFKDHVEPLSTRKDQGRGTQAPKPDEVQLFLSRAQAVFDSAAELLLQDAVRTPANVRRLRLSSVDGSDTRALPDSYTQERLMELACVAFAALVLADSGTNLAVLQSYEESEDLKEQLMQPEKVNLRGRATKFRAGGKLVPVHLTALTTTRLRAYLRVRQAFVKSLRCDDIRPLFVQGAYWSAWGKTNSPITVKPLDRQFLTNLRKKFSSVGAELPQVTLRQLRSYKQQHLVRHQPLAVAAAVMGHSVETAVRSYCRAQQGLRAAEMSQFLRSLERTVRSPREVHSRPSSTEALPVGACADFGKPMPSEAKPLVQPDCTKVEGCFFCDNYRLHADAKDLRKLVSCRVALKRVASLQPDSVRAERVYFAIVDRIDALLSEIQRRIPGVYEDVRQDVEERGNLTPYWATKLQQLHLLGMLPDETKA